MKAEEIVNYRWMVEWRNANGSGNAFVVGATEKEARRRFKQIYPNTDIEKVESQGEIKE